jgi:aryl-alcohol dehydrogenase-like predicted oxidoreductase
LFSKVNLRQKAKAMKYRKFKEVEICEVGLGTWQLGGADWGPVDEGRAFEVLNTFAELGGNFIDTADVYGMGVSERTIGKFLKSTDKNFIVASKLGRRSDGSNGWPQNFSYEQMRQHVEESLEHLQLDTLFLEQLHCIPTTELEAGHVFDHLRRLHQDKLIQHWGVSVETADEALLCLKQDGLASLQIIFNLFRQHYAEAFFAEAKAKDVALIARVPLASGLLSGKYSKETTFAGTDHRNFNANGEAFNAGETFSGIEFNKGVEFAQYISGSFPDERTAQWAIRWILDHPEVTTVIPGASNPGQVQSNVAASGLESLSPEVHQTLKKYYQTEIKPLIRGHY